MNKQGIGLEVKVGIFVLIGLVVLGYMTLKIERHQLKTVDGFEITALFDTASGLVKNSPVQIAGIEVGRVKDIALAGNKAKVIMAVRKGIQIHGDAQAVLRTQGVLGDKYVEIFPGSEKAPLLMAGGVISETRSTIELDHLLAKALPAMDNIKSVTESLNEVLGTEEGKNTLKETFTNVRKTTEYHPGPDPGRRHGREIDQGRHPVPRYAGYGFRAEGYGGPNPGGTRDPR
jgi:phospholipid/cholesterol/gamma-HCH transport system substrate-binding protein